MGSEVVTIAVGEKDTIFNIHKNLIRATSAFFYDVLRVDPATDETFALKNIEAAVFKLFVEFLYTKRVPAVSASMTPSTQALRTKQLCQLYAFADHFHLNFEIRNKIMDRIQDGFLIMDKLPEPGLVNGMCLSQLTLLLKSILTSLFTACPCSGPLPSCPPPHVPFILLMSPVN